MNQKFSINNYISFQLDDRSKKIIAGFLSIVVILSILGVLFAFFPINRPEEDPKIEEEVIFAESTLSAITPDKLFYQEVDLADLDIYPSSWAERRFGDKKNDPQISGEQSDPDGDGLSNKLEFIYGSDPLNPDTLCNGESNTPLCVGRNDKQNVDQLISPLTGLRLREDETKLVINFQNKRVVESIKESFDNASKDGFDFTTLYQLSKKVDLMDELADISVITTSDSRQNTINYLQFKTNLVQDILGKSEFESLSTIYSLLKVSDLEKQKSAFNSILEKVKEYPVPDPLKDDHKVYIYTFQQLIKLIDLRIDALTNNKLESEEYREAVKNTSISIAWSHRKINESSFVFNP